MFCEKCGTQMADTERFCPNCGAQQSVINVSAASYGAPAAPAASPFKLYDILVFVAIAIMAIGTFLPLISMNAMGQSASINSFGAISGVSSDEMMGASVNLDMNFGIWIILIAVAIAALYLFNKETFMAIPASFTAGFLVAIMAIFSFIFKLAGSTSSYGVDISNMVSLGIGFWMMLIGAIGTAVLPFTPLAKERGFYLKR